MDPRDVILTLGDIAIDDVAEHWIRLVRWERLDALSVEHAVRLAQNRNVAYVLINVDTHVDAIECLAAVPGIGEMVCIAQAPTVSTILRSLQARASFVVSDDGLEDFVRTVMRSHTGVWLSPSAVNVLAEVILSLPKHFFVRRCAPSSLSARERQVVACLDRGLSYAETGHELGISINTVRYHVRNAYRKSHR